MRWNMLQDGQVYYCEIHPVDGFGEVSRIQMDLIKGQFLVDGCPVGYLPVTIEKHRDFQRAFGEGKSFEVEAFAFQPGRMVIALSLQLHDILFHTRRIICMRFLHR